MATPAQLANFPRPDPSRGFLILCVGKKHSGKSTAARETYRRLDHIDRLCIDPTGDAEPGADAEELSEPLPRGWPMSMSSDPRNLVYRPDGRDPDRIAKMDAALALGINPKERPVVIWCDEAGQMCPTANSAQPNMVLLLNSLRHYGPCSLILCCPRPKKIDTLMISQADLIFIYRLPSRLDRQRLAEDMGFPLERFEAAHAEMLRRGPYWFLLYDSHHDQLWLCPPLPVSPEIEEPQQSSLG
jgi:hypothetical protein